MRPPQVTRPPRHGGPEYASPTPALRMGTVSAAESSATGVGIGLRGSTATWLPTARVSRVAACKLERAAPAGGAKREAARIAVDRSPDRPLADPSRYIGPKPPQP
jgi:hypothetical protein